MWDCPFKKKKLYMYALNIFKYCFRMNQVDQTLLQFAIIRV